MTLFKKARGLEWELRFGPNAFKHNDKVLLRGAYTRSGKNSVAYVVDSFFARQIKNKFAPQGKRSLPKASFYFWYVTYDKNDVAIHHLFPVQHYYRYVTELYSRSK
jgi:hypothetical protein